MAEVCEVVQGMEEERTGFLNDHMMLTPLFRISLLLLFLTPLLPAGAQTVPRTHDYDTVAVAAHDYSYWVITDYPLRNQLKVIRQKDSATVYFNNLMNLYGGDCNESEDLRSAFRISNDTLFLYQHDIVRNTLNGPLKVTETRTRYTYVFTSEGKLELRRKQSGKKGGPLGKEIERMTD